MPWLAVPFQEHAVQQRLSSRFSVAGIPRLVIVGPDGGVSERRVEDRFGRSCDCGCLGYCCRDLPLPKGRERSPTAGAQQPLLTALPLLVCRSLPVMHVRQ